MQMLTEVNTFYIITEGYRQPLIYHRIPGVLGLVYLAAVSVGLDAYGLRVFGRLKKYREARL